MKENVFMRLRYILARIGINPDCTEIDEALPLAQLWQEERAVMICPLIGADSGR